MSQAPTAASVSSLHTIMAALRSDVRFLRFVLPLAPRSLAAVIAGTAVLVTVNVFGVLLVQPVLERVNPARESGSMAGLLSAVVALFGAFLAAPLVAGATRTAIGHISNRMVVVMHARFSSAALAGKTSDVWLDVPELPAAGRNVSERLRNWMLAESLQAAWDVLVMRLSAIPMLFVVATWNWGIAVALAGSLIVASILHGRLMEVTLRAARADGREADIATYFYQFAMARRTAKEVRIFRMGEWLADRVHAWGMRGFDRSEQNFTTASRRALGSSLVCLAAHVVALAALGADLLSDPSGAPGAVVLILAIVALNGLGPVGDRGVMAAAGRVTNDSLDHFERLVGQASVSRPADAAECCAPDVAIALSEVTFGYGKQQPPVLDGLDLVVRRGQRIGVVGVNGAGKSTLAAVVAGVLTPTSGRVSVCPSSGNGPAVAWVTQDFLKYPGSVEDNVWLGHPGHTAGLGDLGKSLDLRHDSAGPEGVVGSPDLSGGQWQRVALARGAAAAGRGAEVVVLDEPTASLDAEAEARFFDALVDSLPEQTIILISHRLSSVRRADVIHVLADGAVAESGTHSELMSRRGVYFTMFTAQASRYQL